LINVVIFLDEKRVLPGEQVLQCSPQAATILIELGEGNAQRTPLPDHAPTGHLG
jgi:hypothetical protein